MFRNSVDKSKYKIGLLDVQRIAIQLRIEKNGNCIPGLGYLPKFHLLNRAIVQAIYLVTLDSRKDTENIRVFVFSTQFFKERCQAGTHHLRGDLTGVVVGHRVV